MDFLQESILNYSEKFSSPQNKILQELERETQYKVLMPRMMSGNLMGSFLKFISQMIQPKHILEIGTYTGYSAICLASGLQKNGKLQEKNKMTLPCLHRTKQKERKKKEILKMKLYPQF